LRVAPEGDRHRLSQGRSGDRALPHVAGTAQVPQAAVRETGEVAGEPRVRAADLREGAADVPPGLAGVHRCDPESSPDTLNNFEYHASHPSMTEWDLDAARHCETGLQHLWRGEVDDALAAYDRGLALETSDETRELLTIRKAEALIAGDREGAEVVELAGIVMRRRVPYHVYLAAYT